MNLYLAHFANRIYQYKLAIILVPSSKEFILCYSKIWLIVNGMIRSKSNSRTNSKDYNTLLARAKAQFVQGTFKNVQFMLCEFSAVMTAPKAISKIPQHASVLTVFRLTITKATILGTSKLHRLFVIVAIMSHFINSPFAISTNKTVKNQLFVVKHNRLL